MNTNDAFCNGLVIRRIINVVCSTNKNRNKTTRVHGRHSDALIYVLHGSCDYSFDDGGKFTVKSGDILYLSHRSHYAMTVTDEYYKVIFCDFEFDLDDARQCFVCSPDATEYVKGLFQKLYRAQAGNAAASFAESMSLLYSIYAEAISSRRQDSSHSGTPEVARQYILEHLDGTELSVSALAIQCNVSEVYLRRTFKSAYGTSPAQFITSERLKKAKSLMKYPFISLEDCALQSGFSSLQYFCRVFKNETGETPAKYRKDEYGI